MKLAYLSALAVASTVAGQVVLHPNTATNKCLDVRGGVLANGTPVQVFDCNGSAAQKWELNSGQTSVRVANSNFCLDTGKTPGLNTPMKIWECYDNLPAQQWFLSSDNRIASISKPGLCLDLTKGDLTNSNVVQVYTCRQGDGNTNQIWLE